MKTLILLIMSLTASLAVACGTEDKKSPDASEYFCRYKDPSYEICLDWRFIEIQWDEESNKEALWLLTHLKPVMTSAAIADTARAIVLIGYLNPKNMKMRLDHWYIITPFHIPCDAGIAEYEKKLDDARAQIQSDNKVENPSEDQEHLLYFLAGKKIGTMSYGLTKDHFFGDVDTMDWDKIDLTRYCRKVVKIEIIKENE